VLLLQLLHAGTNKRLAAEQPEPAVKPPVKRVRHVTAAAATTSASANISSVKVEAAPAKTAARPRGKGGNGKAKAATKPIPAVETAPLARKPATAPVAKLCGEHA
jgi:hypothetical protein